MSLVYIAMRLVSLLALVLVHSKTLMCGTRQYRHRIGDKFAAEFNAAKSSRLLYRLELAFYASLVFTEVQDLDYLMFSCRQIIFV